MTIIKQYPFSTPGDYTYDSNLIEVTGGVAKLKLQTYSEETFYARYNSSIDGDRGSGSLVAVETGGVVIANNRLDLTGGTNKYLTYSGITGIALVQQGCVEIDIYPNYNGTPTDTQYFICSREVDGTINSQVHIEHHKTAGLIRAILSDNTGAVILTIDGEAFSPVAGNKYTFSLNFDIDVGSPATRVFINGVQYGETDNSTGTRSANGIAFIGKIKGVSSTLTEFEAANARFFSAVQHTEDYTPSADYTDYPINPPSISQTEPLSSKSLDGYSGTANGTGNVGHLLNVDNIDMFWNGSIWVASTGSDDVNTIAEIETNKAELDLSAGTSIYPKWYLASDNGWTTPEIDLIQIDYTFFNVTDELNTCLVYIEVYDEEKKPVEGAMITIKPKGFIIGEAMILTPIVFYTGADGKGQADVIETASTSSTVDITVFHKESGEIEFLDRIIPTDAKKALTLILAAV